jgi:CubicO group peptidase (beta-lactamase class C family)
MILRPIGTLFLASLLLAPCGARAQSVDERISAVESGLRRATSVRGEDATFRLAERMRALAVPGVSIAVIDGGRIAWAKGYGVADVDGTQPVDTATLFQAASISKPVAALAALRLVERGALDLDADVNTGLVSWRVEDNEFTRDSRVTLRRLLSHNAGLTVHGFRGYAAGEDVPTLVQLLSGDRPANSAVVRPDVVPGSLWRYSGGGSSVAQLLMEDVTGTAFPDLVRELVLQPAGMAHSGYEQPLPEARAGVAATGHRPGGRPVTGKWHTYPEMFAAGLWTTPADLARLALEVQQAYDGRSSRLLSQAMAQQMLTPQAGEYGLGFGLAAGVGWTAFSHGGANEGFRAMFYALTNGQGAVVMTNSDNGATLAGEILRAISHEYDWPTYRSVERDVVRLPASALRELAGDYTFERNGAVQTLRIRLDDNGVLRSAGPPLGPHVLLASAPDTCFMLDNTILLRFQRDDAGAVTGATLETGADRLALVRLDATGG